MREERRLMEEGKGMASEKLLCVAAGGSGDLDREVERELWPDLTGRMGM